MQFGISRAETQSDENIPLAVTHAEHAPNLVDYLSARGINIVKVEFDEAAARAGRGTRRRTTSCSRPRRTSVKRLQARRARACDPVFGQLARLRAAAAWRACARLVSHYGIEIAQLRFLARGIDPISVLPISVQEIDVSTPTRPLGAGAQHDDVPGAAVDVVRRLCISPSMPPPANASAARLEVLLTSPVPREQLIYGKIARRGVHAASRWCSR